MTEIKKFSLILVLVSCSILASSQYYVISDNDSVAFEEGSLLLNITDLPGIINWEISRDTLSWESLGINNDSLRIHVDSSSYFRAVLSDGTCYPVKSSMAYIALRSIPVEGTIVEIDPLGGVYSLPSGIKLVVPPDAVTEKTSITLEVLDSTLASVLLPSDVLANKKFSACVSCKPQMISFLKPVRLRIPVSDYEVTDIPYLHSYDTLTEQWNYHPDPLICNEKEQYIEFRTRNLSSTRISLIKDVFGNRGKTMLKSSEAYDCKSLIAEIRNTAHDFAGQKGQAECSVVSDHLSVKFPLCKGSPEETAIIQQIAGSCNPEIRAELSDDCLSANQSATLTINVCIGGLPLENQQVFIALPEGLRTDIDHLGTDKFGNARFTITFLTDNLKKSIINYSVHIQYYLETIMASADGISETSRKDQRTIEVDSTVSVGCSEIKYVELSSDGGQYRLKKGETDHISCNCYDRNRQKVDCGEVVYSVAPGSSYPVAGAVAINSQSGAVQAVHPGVTGIQATASGVTSENFLSYSVAYEGHIFMEDVTDHDNMYGWCGCAEDKENPLTYYALTMYKVTYTVDNHLFLWLGSSKSNSPWGDCEGLNSYKYEIDDISYCNNAFWFENVDGIDGGYTFSYNSTLEAISGNEFNVAYSYYDYEGIEGGNINTIYIICKMISPGVFSADVVNFWLHGCVGNKGKIYPADFKFE